MKFKTIFEKKEPKAKFKKGQSIIWYGDEYKITDIINDEMAGLWVYKVNTASGDEMTLDLKEINKTAKAK